MIALLLIATLVSVFGSPAIELPEVNLTDNFFTHFNKITSKERADALIELDRNYQLSEDVASKIVKHCFFALGRDIISATDTSRVFPSTDLLKCGLPAVKKIYKDSVSEFITEISDHVLSM